MTNTYATNILSDSSKKYNGSDLVGSMSIQKIKNKTPRNNFKHSIGTSARRNDEDPDTISEHNAESLSRDNEADVEVDDQDGDSNSDGGGDDEQDDNDQEDDGEEDMEDNDDEDNEDNHTTNRNSTKRSILKKSFDKQNRNSKLNHNNRDRDKVKNDSSVDPAKLRETEIAFGG